MAKTAMGSARLKRVTITVDPEDYACIEKMAKSGSVSASWLIRRSMREFLDRHGREGSIEIISENEGSTL